MNSATFTGRLVADPQPVKDVGSTRVLNFRLASDTGFGDRKSALFLNCAVWGARADGLAPNLSKGSFVVVSGELSQREYEKDGATRQSLELRVGELDFGPKQAVAAGGAQPDTIPF